MDISWASDGSTAVEPLLVDPVRSVETVSYFKAALGFKGPNLAHLSCADPRAYLASLASSPNRSENPQVCYRQFTSQQTRHDNIIIIIIIIIIIKFATYTCMHSESIQLHAVLLPL